MSPIKKSTALIILVVFVVSIVYVSFFGLKINSYEDVIYVDKVECLNSDFRTQEDGTNLLAFRLDSSEHYNEDDGYFYYQLEWRVYPDNSTNKSVTFVYDDANEDFSISPRGIIKAKGKRACTISIVADGGNNKKIEILFVLY